MLFLIWFCWLNSLTKPQRTQKPQRNFVFVISLKLIETFVLPSRCWAVSTAALPPATEVVEQQSILQFKRQREGPKWFLPSGGEQWLLSQEACFTPNETTETEMPSTTRLTFWQIWQKLIALSGSVRSYNAVRCPAMWSCSTLRWLFKIGLKPNLELPKV